MRNQLFGYISVCIIRFQHVSLRASIHIPILYERTERVAVINIRRLLDLGPLTLAINLLWDSLRRPVCYPTDLLPQAQQVAVCENSLIFCSRLCHYRLLSNRVWEEWCEFSSSCRRRSLSCSVPERDCGPPFTVRITLFSFSRANQTSVASMGAAISSTYPTITDSSVHFP